MSTSSKSSKRHEKMLRRLRRKERQQRKHDIPACPSIEELAIYDESLEYTPSFGNEDTKPSSDETSCISEADFAKIREALKSVGQSVNDGNPFADDGLKERCDFLRQQAKNRALHLSRPTLTKEPPANGPGYASSNRRNVALARQSFSDTDHQMRMLDRGLPYCTSSSTIKYHSEYNRNGSYASLCFCKVMAVLSKIIFESGAMLMHISSTYPAVVGFLALAILLYCLILYLEFSVAIIVETTMQWSWPTFHILLRGLERVLKGTANFIGQMDDIGQSVYCDMADTWCKQFSLMCNQKCTYTSLAIDRMR